MKHVKVFKFLQCATCQHVKRSKCLSLTPVNSGVASIDQSFHVHSLQWNSRAFCYIHKSFSHTCAPLCESNGNTSSSPSHKSTGLPLRYEHEYDQSFKQISHRVNAGVEHHNSRTVQVSTVGQCPQTDWGGVWRNCWHPVPIKVTVVSTSE